MSRSKIATTAPSSSPAAVTNRIRHHFDGALIRLLGSALSRTPAGRLQLTLPSGRGAIVGPVDRDVAVEIVLKNYGAFSQIARRGSLGFAGSYMGGDIETGTSCEAI